jgi:hypothetical protein
MSLDRAFRAFPFIATAMLGAVLLVFAMPRGEAVQDLTKSECTAEWCQYVALHGEQAWFEKMAQDSIDEQVAEQTAGHACWTDDRKVFPKYVLFHENGEVVVGAMPFAKAWKVNTDKDPHNDVWVDAKCN